MQATPQSSRPPAAIHDASSPSDNTVATPRSLPFPSPAPAPQLQLPMTPDDLESLPLRLRLLHRSTIGQGSPAKDLLSAPAAPSSAPALSSFTPSSFSASSFSSSSSSQNFRAIAKPKRTPDSIFSFNNKRKQVVIPSPQKSAGAIQQEDSVDDIVEYDSAGEEEERQAFYALTRPGSARRALLTDTDKTPTRTRQDKAQALVQTPQPTRTPSPSCTSPHTSDSPSSSPPHSPLLSTKKRLNFGEIASPQVDDDIAAFPDDSSVVSRRNPPVDDDIECPDKEGFEDEVHNSDTEGEGLANSAHSSPASPATASDSEVDTGRRVFLLSSVKGPLDDIEEDSLGDQDPQDDPTIDPSPAPSTPSPDSSTRRSAWLNGITPPALDTQVMGLGFGAIPSNMKQIRGGLLDKLQKLVALPSVPVPVQTVQIVQVFPVQESNACSTVCVVLDFARTEDSGSTSLDSVDPTDIYPSETIHVLFSLAVRRDLALHVGSVVNMTNYREIVASSPSSSCNRTLACLSGSPSEWRPILLDNTEAQGAPVAPPLASASLSDGVRVSGVVVRAILRGHDLSQDVSSDDQTHIDASLSSMMRHRLRLNATPQVQPSSTASITTQPSMLVLDDKGSLCEIVCPSRFLPLWRDVFSGPGRAYSLSKQRMVSETRLSLLGNTGLASLLRTWLPTAETATYKVLEIGAGSSWEPIHAALMEDALPLPATIQVAHLQQRVSPDPQYSYERVNFIARPLMLLDHVQSDTRRWSLYLGDENSNVEMRLASSDMVDMARTIMSTTSASSCGMPC
eukprot:TRINITY_DN5576_c0_g1_i5.p1 TRINITY_DN5576_c0_g1~~TRINITY_DN5576_c0_g1_i5.p1  ORF type:complete len:818 (+),score=204.54 TRINITY_DN5576_c0_g1_i5:81-2456(+)